MSRDFDQAFEYKLIYVLAINDAEHQGLLKIGDATLKSDKKPDELKPDCSELNKAAAARIKQYTATAGISPNLLHTELALIEIRKDNYIQLLAFRDHNVHSVLKNSGIKRMTFDKSAGREWFMTDLKTAVNAIRAVKAGKSSLSGKEISENNTPVLFRPEQEDAIRQTLQAFRRGNRFLWNAKMRFGKTLSALQVVKQARYGKTLIVTHRPVVDEGWFEDFNKIFYDRPEYAYGSKHHGTDLSSLIKRSGKFVYFASIQDLRGSARVGGRFDKNALVFSTEWDLVIADEAHEGTTTALGEDVIKNLIGGKTRFLALSGTPFNILRDFEDNVYTWDYTMEQRSKREWDLTRFGDSNPYEELPSLTICTYDLGESMRRGSYVDPSDMAFNFREFFRVWTGDVSADLKKMPDSAAAGDFVHQGDVMSLLNMLTRDDSESNYPFSRPAYRDIFKHTLWMVPGVKEAKALSAMLKRHPVFGSGAFEIVNVAGAGDDDYAGTEDDLQKVRDAIRRAGDDGYTITLSCGKLTQGVTVPEWTAVLMLAGSNASSPANYLQTIFRVQSPCNRGGKIKRRCYAFDFAPDRTLKMISEAAAVSARAGKTRASDRKILGEFLNYCPVIAISGSQMKAFDADRLLQRLKQVYAERAVLSGFDDTGLYSDELLRIGETELEQFEKLKTIIGTSKAAHDAKDIDVNTQGLTNEQYDRLAKIDGKKKSELTEEDKLLLKEVRQQQERKRSAISILRGISIRMPLMIYGADIPFEDDITIERFPDLVDDTSWEEFMPKGVTKDVFRLFVRYYDPDVFIEAGHRIRNIVKNADELPPAERVKRIATLFASFRNPDKETVMTPWRVVNMHMSDCIGGYDFFDAEHKHMLAEPRFADQGRVTRDVFDDPDVRLLEINSKSGLYPLYLTFGIFRRRCERLDDTPDLSAMRRIWNETVKNNIFVICKTPMAKQITKRTLLGYQSGTINAHYFDDLINTVKNKPRQTIEKLLKPGYWKLPGNKPMKFTAIVSNPPYQLMDGGNNASAQNIFPLFVSLARDLKPDYVSMIIPARWYTGGKGLEDFRRSMLGSKNLCKLVDYADSTECFQGVIIAGGICYFLLTSEGGGW